MIITDELIDSLLDYSAEEELSTILGPLGDGDETTETILALMSVQNENNLIIALKARGDTYPTMDSRDYTEVAEDLDFIQQVGFSSTRWGKYVECDLMWNDGVLLETVYHEGVINNARLYFNWITTEKDKTERFLVEEDIKITVTQKEGNPDLYVVSGSIDVTAGLAHTYLRLFTEGIFLDHWVETPTFGRINDVSFLYDTLTPEIQAVLTEQ